VASIAADTDIRTGIDWILCGSRSPLGNTWGRGDRFPCRVAEPWSRSRGSAPGPAPQTPAGLEWLDRRRGSKDRGSAPDPAPQTPARLKCSLGVEAEVLDRRWG